MSNSHQTSTDDALIRFWSLDHPSADSVEWPPTTWPMLAYAEKGVMTVESAGRRWLLPPHRAMWISAGERWTMFSRGAISIRSLYFAAGIMSRESGIIEVRPLLRELIREACRVGPLTANTEVERSLVALIAEESRGASALPFALPMPEDQEGLEIAERYLTNPAQFPDAISFAKCFGYSLPTVDRYFRDAVKMTTAKWMQAARLHVGLREIASGASISDAAFDAGYSCASGLGVAFHRHFGMTPAEARSTMNRR